MSRSGWREEDREELRWDERAAGSDLPWHLSIEPKRCRRIPLHVRYASHTQNKNVLSVVCHLSLKVIISPAAVVCKNYYFYYLG